MILLIKIVFVLDIFHKIQFSWYYGEMHQTCIKTIIPIIWSWAIIRDDLSLSAGEKPESFGEMQKVVGLFMIPDCWHERYSWSNGFHYVLFFNFITLNNKYWYFTTSRFCVHSKPKYNYRFKSIIWFYYMIGRIIIKLVD